MAPIRRTIVDNKARGITPPHYFNVMPVSLGYAVNSKSPFNGDITELAIIPLDFNYKIEKEFRIFSAKIRPELNPGERPIGLPGYQVSGLLEEWMQQFEKYGIVRLAPIVYNWGFVKPFMFQGLMPATIENLIKDSDVRDLTQSFNFLKDREWIRHGRYSSDLPFDNRYYKLVKYISSESDTSSKVTGLMQARLNLSIYYNMMRLISV